MGNNIENRVVDLQLYSDDFKRNCDEAIVAINRLNKALEMKGSDQSFIKLEKAAASVSFEKLATSAEQVSSAMKDISAQADSLTSVATNASEGSKEITNLQRAAEQVDLSNIENSVDSINNKLSALNVIAASALSSMASMAIKTGKKIAMSLTGISAMQSGFREYETQINAVQTILSNTQSKGSTIQDVTAALDELNEYADKTIYNFTEMTRNIGTFTAAGVGLEESTKAIQGIANLAAISGSNATQASTAMYQLSQALSSGTVKLQDWNSVINAGMGGELFRNQLIKTAKTMGIAADEIIESAGSFKESLKEGWITSDVLTQTLQKLTKSGAAEYLSELTGINKDEITAMQELVDKNEDGAASYDELAEKMEKTGKISKQDAIDILKMADNAEDAATKVKTVTQLMDTLKESIQSGWTKSFEIVFGNFEEAKKTLTAASVAFDYIVGKISDARNDFLQDWKDLNGRDYAVDAILSAINIIKSFIDIAFDAFKKIHGLLQADSVVEFFYSFKVGMQNFALFRGETSKLTKLGKTLKGIFKGIFSILEIGLGTITTIWTILRPIVRLIGSFVGGVLYSALKVLSSIGNLLAKFSKWLKDINAISKLSKPFTDFATSVKNLKDSFNFEKTLKTLKASLTNLKKSFNSLWETIKVLVKPITDLKVSLSTKMDVKPIDLVRKIFEKFATAVNFISEKISNVSNKIKEFAGLAKNINILDLIADKASSFKELFGSIAKQLDEIRLRINDIFSKIENSKAAQRLKELTNIFVDFKNKLIKQLFPNQSTENIGKNIIDGIANGIQSKIEHLWSVVKSVATNILDTICDVLGIQSPSTEGKSIGENLVNGIILGIEKISSALFKIVGSLGGSLLDGFVHVFGTLIPKVLATISTFMASVTTSLNSILPQIRGFFSSLTSSFIAGLAGIADALSGNQGEVIKAITSIINTIMNIVMKIFTVKFMNSLSKGSAKISKSISSLFDNLAKTINVNFNGINKATKPAMNTAQKIRVIAEAVLMLAIAFKMMDGIKTEKLESMTTMLGGLMIVMMSYSEVMNVVDKKFGSKSDSLYKVILSLAVMTLTLSYLIKTIDKIKNPEQVFDTLIVCFGGLAGLIYIMSQISLPDEKKVDSIGKLIAKLAVVLILISVALKIVDSLKNVNQDLIALAGVLFALTIVVAALTLLDSGKMDSIEKLIPKFVLLGALLLMIAVALRIVDGGEQLYTDALALIMVLGALSLAVFLLGKFGSFDESLKQANKTILTLGVVLLAIAAALWIIGQTRGALVGAEILSKLLLKVVVAVGILAVISKFAPEVSVVTYVLLALAALILSFAISINLLVRAIEYIGNIDPEIVSNGISSIAKALAIIGAVSLVAAPGLALLGAAFLLLGPGLLATGVGLTSLVSAIQVFIIVFTTMTALIPQAIDNFIGMRDSFVELLTALLTMGIETLSNALPQMVDMIVDSLLEILTKLDENSDEIFSKVGSLMKKLLDFLATQAPIWGRQGVNIAIGFLKGMWQGFTDQFPNLSSFLSSLWNKIITGIKSIFGINSSESVKFKDIAHQIIHSFTKGVKNTAKKAKNAMVDVAKKCIKAIKNKVKDFINVGKNLVQGIIDGITSMFKNAWQAGKDLVSKIIHGSEEEGEIKSPSRAMRRIGAFLTEGFILGIQDHDPTVTLKKTIIEPLNATSKATKKFISDAAGALTVGEKSFKRSFTVLGNVLSKNSKNLALNSQDLKINLAESMGKKSLLDTSNNSKLARKYRNNVKKQSTLNSELKRLEDKKVTVQSAIDTDTANLKTIENSIKNNEAEKKKITDKITAAEKEESALQATLAHLQKTKTYTTYETVTTTTQIQSPSTKTTTPIAAPGANNAAEISRLQRENEQLDARINQEYDREERERLRNLKRANLNKIQQLQNAQNDTTKKTNSNNATSTDSGTTKTVTSSQLIAKQVTTTIGSEKEINDAKQNLKKKQDEIAKLKTQADAFQKKIDSAVEKQQNKIKNNLSNEAELDKIKQNIAKTEQELNSLNEEIAAAEQTAANKAKNSNAKYFDAAQYLSNSIAIKADKLYKKSDNYAEYKQALKDEKKLQDDYEKQRTKIFKDAGALDPRFTDTSIKAYNKQIGKYSDSTKDAKRAYEKTYNDQQKIINYYTNLNKKAKTKEAKDDNNKKIQAAKDAQAQAKKDYETTKKYNDKQIEKINKLIGYKKDVSEINKKMTESEKKVAEAEAKRIEDTANLWNEYLSTFEGVVTDMSSILASGLSNQLDIFNKFEKDTSKSISQIINEMQSQVKGTADFYKNLEKLGSLGYNVDYIRELESQGTSVAGIVETLTKATKSEIESINKSWRDKTLLESDIYLRNATQKMMDQDALITMTANLMMAGLNTDMATSLYSAGDLATLKAVTAATLNDSSLIKQLNNVQKAGQELTDTAPELLSAIIAMIEEGNFEALTSANNQQISSVLTEKSLERIEKLANNINNNFTKYAASQATKSINTTYLGTEKVENTTYFTQNIYSNTPINPADFKREMIPMIDRIMYMNT